MAKNSSTGEKIFDLLAERKMTQVELSKRTGIPTSTINDWKKKKNTPAADKIVLVAKALGVSINEILQDDKEKVDYRIVYSDDSLWDIIEIYDRSNNSQKDRIKKYLKGFSEKKDFTVQKTFNTTGVCKPSEHYMVDIQERLIKVKRLVDEGKFFTVNRARQFGKTTMLYALSDFLKDKYLVVSMDFQMQMSNAKFSNEKVFSLAFAKAFIQSFNVSFGADSEDNKSAKNTFEDAVRDVGEEFDLPDLFVALSDFCAAVDRPVILMIDEVDSATNNQVFIDFLAQLRGYYLKRDRFSIFQSVILAGVCDIKNFRRKLRPDDEHRDNSPWNIAADFDIEMSFNADQIANMLKSYADDYGITIREKEVASEIYAFTGGYPYLVSRVCLYLHNLYTDKNDLKMWSKKGVLTAVNLLVKESNSLFDDLAKKLNESPKLKDFLEGILFSGKSMPFNINAEIVSIGYMYGFLLEENGQVAISNRIFEIWLYNLFIAESAIDNVTYKTGESVKNKFCKNNSLDMESILEKFVEHFSEVYGDNDTTFIEENGRKIFLLYIRPFINGVGNYYIESRTRNMGRTDLIIDYLGIKYVIELKIWHGDEYNSRGEDQLIGYLKDHKVKTGYMVSFNFNKSKQVGVKKIHFSKHTLIEAVC